MKFDILVEKILSTKFLVERVGKKIVIFPGGFHPFHLGHKSVFDNIKNQFPDADSYIAITDYTEDRPFTAKEKKLIISSTGVDGKKVVQVKSPFRSEEILKNYNPDKDVVIFAISEKERNDPKKAGLFTRTKKDGTPSYFQDYDPSSLQTFGKHGYIFVFPTEEFSIAGKKFKSASQLREFYKSLKDKEKTSLLKSMYIKNIDQIKKLFDKRLAGSSEENEMSQFIDKERIKDENKAFGVDGIYKNPPYLVDNEISVGRMKY